MIAIRAKQGLEDVFDAASAKLAGIEAAEAEEIEREIARVREEIAAKYADHKRTLTAVVDALSEPYEVEDPPVEEQTQAAEAVEPVYTDPNLANL